MVRTKSCHSTNIQSKIRFNLEQTTTFNEDSIWEEESLSSEREQTEIEFSEVGKPFIISLCKVEGESSEDQSPKDDDHSTGSSFKCYKHRSKPKTENYYNGQFGQGIQYIVHSDDSLSGFDVR